MEPVSGSFQRTVLGRTGLEVERVGISSSYGASGDDLERAFARGVNYIYWGSRRTASFGEGLKRLRPQRDRFVLVIQSYTRVAGLMAWSLERALRTLRIERADVLLLGMWNKPVPPKILEAARQLKQRGLVRFLAVSTHQRSLVPQISAASDFDIVHFRYNAAHPGAEADIFPKLPAANRPGLVAFTATSWGQLVGNAKWPASWITGGHPHPKGERAPTATDCYRYVLSRPEVDVCMTGLSNSARMDEALEALAHGPMSGRSGVDAARRQGGGGEIKGRHLSYSRTLRVWLRPVGLARRRCALEAVRKVVTAQLWQLWQLWQLGGYSSVPKSSRSSPIRSAISRTWRALVSHNYPCATGLWATALNFRVFAAIVGDLTA